MWTRCVCLSPLLHTNWLVAGAAIVVLVDSPSSHPSSHQQLELGYLLVCKSSSA